MKKFQTFRALPFFSGCWLVCWLRNTPRHLSFKCLSPACAIRIEVLCDWKSGCTLGNTSEMFAKVFPKSAPSFADVNVRAATKGDAVYKAR